jgi:hypothetical protein
MRFHLRSIIIAILNKQNKNVKNSYIAGENINGVTVVENRMMLFKKKKHRIAI